MLKIKDKVQVYIEDYNDNGLKKLFDKKENYRYVFRHSDCPIVFTTDGYNIFAMDMDNKDIPLFENGIFNLDEYYNDFNEFLADFKRIEILIGYELFLSNYTSTSTSSIRELEINYINKILKNK